MKFRYFALLLIILPLKAMSPEEKQYYTQKYAVPAELKAQLDALKPECFWRHHYLQDKINVACGLFRVKKQLDRLKGMEIIREVAKQQECDLVITPQKYAYADPDNPQHTVVIAEEIEETDAPFSLNQIKQICTVVRKSKFRDVHCGNILPTTDGKVAFIDTEMRGFSNSPNSVFRTFNKYQDREMALEKAYMELDMTPDARAYVHQEIKNEETREAIHEWVEEKIAQEQKRTVALQNIRAAYDAIKSRLS